MRDVSPADCKTCIHAHITGSWPPELLNQGGTHCDGCHQDWTSKTEAHCSTCHLHFTSNHAAELHDPYCHPDTETTRRRLVAARRASGHPLLALRDRRHGPVFASWSPKPSEEPPDA